MHQFARAEISWEAYLASSDALRTSAERLPYRVVSEVQRMVVLHHYAQHDVAGHIGLQDLPFNRFWHLDLKERLSQSGLDVDVIGVYSSERELHGVQGGGDGEPGDEEARPADRRGRPVVDGGDGQWFV